MHFSFVAHFHIGSVVSFVLLDSLLLFPLDAFASAMDKDSDFEELSFEDEFEPEEEMVEKNKLK